MLRTHLKGDRKLRLRQQSFDNPQVFLGVVQGGENAPQSGVAGWAGGGKSPTGKVVVCSSS